MRTRLVLAWTVALAAMAVTLLGASPSIAQPRPHVYLMRGLLNIFSLGMDTLAGELEAHGIQTTVANHTEWQSYADQAAAGYRNHTQDPIILIGHSLGADAVMVMADYLDKKGVPVALLVPFDASQSYSTPANVARLLNLTQRDYAYMRRGPGFHGSLVNFDVSSDPSINHLNIDKSPRLHAMVIRDILALVAKQRPAAPQVSGKPPVLTHAPQGNGRGVNTGSGGTGIVKPAG
jgi:pimeloyl-ACP methyl ester carboxylesterase